MSSFETKQKILATALGLFNEAGFVNVRLQHISDASIISVGNIAYHYKNKEEIVHAVWQKMESEKIRLINEFKTLPLLEDTERYLASTFALQQAYIFFYQDTLELLRTCPALADPCRKHLAWQEYQVYFMFKFNEARGAFRPEGDLSDYQWASRQWLWQVESWVYQRRVRGLAVGQYEAFRADMWAFLKGFFTSEGLAEYRGLRQMASLSARE